MCMGRVHQLSYHISSDVHHCYSTAALAGLTIFNCAQVAGNIHFAPGKSYQQGNMHVHDLVPFPDKNFDLSHTITKLTFGKGYPGQQNPLDGVAINQTTSAASQAATGMWQYFLKVC